MRRALLFNYYWPPCGGPAVQRWLTLSEHLRAEGIELTVITVDETKASYALVDETLNQKIPEGLKVIKTNTLEPFNLYAKTIGKGKIPTAGFANESNPSFVKKLARWVRGNLFIPDPRKGWNRYAYRAALKELKNEDYQLIITAGPPHSTHLIGQKLKQKTGLKWVADFHDAWTGIWYYDELLKGKRALKLDTCLEKGVLQSADKILTVGAGLKADLARLGQISESKIQLHSMGYDEEKFDAKNEIPTQQFVITYTGTMAANYQPEIFLQSVKELVEEGANIHINFIGLIADSIKSEVTKAGLDNHVIYHGYQPHEVAVAQMLKSCLLLLVNPNTAQSRLIIPGKIYEYLAARIPILNLAEHGMDTEQIIDECQAGATFNRLEKDELKDFIELKYKAWQLNPEALVVENSNYKKYSRKTEAAALASVLKELST